MFNFFGENKLPSHHISSHGEDELCIYFPQFPDQLQGTQRILGMFVLYDLKQDKMRLSLVPNDADNSTLKAVIEHSGQFYTYDRDSKDKYFAGWLAEAIKKDALQRNAPRRKQHEEPLFDDRPTDHVLELSAGDDNHCEKIQQHLKDTRLITAQTSTILDIIRHQLRNPKEVNAEALDMDLKAFFKQQISVA